ncbi:MAG: dehydrogenase [Clostridia bacterium]|nr:dehydrogenase [Clostridia bacterium]
MSGYMYTETARRSAGDTVRFREIPVCRYQLSVFDERRIYSPREFLRIYRDMALIREFETMLSDLKTSGSYRGIVYPIRDDIPLDIGREAVSVGEAYCLDKKDFMFSSEKNIGDMIAKGLYAIGKMSDREVIEIMQKYHEGAILEPLEDIVDDDPKPKDVAIDYLLYGILSEIFCKITGFQYGLGGPANIYFPPFGTYPNNTLTSGAAGLAVGGALYKRNCGTDGFIVANMNENSACDGNAWEALCLSEDEAFRTADRKQTGLPILFTLIRRRENSETVSAARKCIARIAAGLDANMMHAETVNGSDPLAVIDAVTRKKERLVRGEGPALLELICDDLSENAAGADPVRLYRRKLLDSAIATEEDLSVIDAHILNRIERVCRLAADDEKSPRASAENIEAIVFGPEDEKALKPAKDERILPEVYMPKAENARLQAIGAKTRSAYNADGTPAEKNARYHISDALFEPVLDALYSDPKFIVCAMKREKDASDVYEGLDEALPKYRFFRANASEAAIVSMALGYVMCGGRALVSLENGDSLAHIADVLIRQIAKWRAMSGGELRIPLVLRVPVRDKKDAQNADELVSLAVSVPGLKVIYPATPYDAKGLMTAALKENNPVVCFENERIEDIGEYFEKDGVPTEPYALKLGDVRLKKEGSDLTILTVGAALYRAIEAAGILEEKYGVSAEVISAASLVPFDYTPVLQSIEKTGKVLIVGEAPERGSVMREIAAGIAEMAFDMLDAPPIALGAKNGIKPPSVYMKEFYPTAMTILDVIHQRILPLEGYTPVYRTSAEEKCRLSKKGI